MATAHRAVFLVKSSLSEASIATRRRPTPSCTLRSTFLSRRLLWANPNLPRRPRLRTTRRSPRKLSRRGCKAPGLRLRGGKEPPHAGPLSVRGRGRPPVRATELSARPRWGRGARARARQCPAHDPRPRGHSPFLRVRLQRRPAGDRNPHAEGRSEGSKPVEPAREARDPPARKLTTQQPARRAAPPPHVSSGAGRARAVGAGPARPGRVNSDPGWVAPLGMDSARA